MQVTSGAVRRRAGAEHLVYASSSSVYGGNTQLPFSEHDNIDHPVSLYAATKKANELMAHSYSHLYRLPTTGLRFFTVYGPWGRPDMAPMLFARAILDGRPITVFNHGKMQRDFTYVDDIVEGVARTLARPPAADGAPYAIYNIGNHTAVELDLFIATLERLLGRAAIREYAPMQPGDVPATYASIDRLAAATGFAPKTPLDEGLARFVAWYRDTRGADGPRRDDDRSPPSGMAPPRVAPSRILVTGGAGSSAPTSCSTGSPPRARRSSISTCSPTPATSATCSRSPATPGTFSSAGYRQPRAGRIAARRTGRGRSSTSPPRATSTARSTAPRRSSAPTSSARSRCSTRSGATGWSSLPPSARRSASCTSPPTRSTARSGPATPRSPRPRPMRRTAPTRRRRRPPTTWCAWHHYGRRHSPRTARTITGRCSWLVR
jgi:dTDP-4-dehydrorhamnose reductase